jgi:hypothetical protein
VSDGSITNAKIASNAAITLSKLAALTASRAAVTDSSGVLTPSSVTATELGYLSGVSGALQTQLDARQPLNAKLTALTGLLNVSGMVAWNGSNAFSLISSSSGGLGTADNGSLSTFGNDGSLTATSAFFLIGSDNATAEWTGEHLSWYDGTGRVSIMPQFPVIDETLEFFTPTASGTLIGTNDSGTVTGGMIANGTIGMTKLATSGTANSTTYLRGDGAWTAMSGGLASTDIDTSAELRAILTDEVGTGAAYFVGGALGTPASGTLTSCTGLPAASVTAGTFGAGNYIAPDNFQVGNSTSDYLSIRANDTGTREIRIGSNYAALGDQAYYIASYAGGALNAGASWYLYGGSVGIYGDVLFYGRIASNSYGTILYLDTAATLKMGADAATATAQTLQAHNGSGTDKDGAAMTVAGGKSTGAGRGGDVSVKTSMTSTTSSSANTYSVRRYDSAKFVNLTESSATLFANVTLASGKYSGMKIVATVTANDGTDYQSLTSDVVINAVNKAGTITAQLSQTDSTTAASSGTLSVTYTAVQNGNAIDIKANAVSSLTQTVLRVKWGIVELNSDDPSTVTAQ